ncbi:MAG: hypothetical protein DMG67_08390 [Acidobacteria bacterium]|nr:MAG: hypothetical protein DMG67_08390 [Acidobacteriota bacterium]
MLICWLTFVAFTTWQHVKKTDLPPIFDATEYFLKAKNFWANLHDRRIHNPLNLEPTFRPPGTVVMSYPFGFNTDFHPYFFRSIFFPLLCMAAAVYVVGSHGPNKGSTRWNLALLAIFVTSLPTFYHFERVTDDNSGLCWGLVDNFFAGIACLAAAALMRSLKTLSLRWLIAGSLLAGFCVLVKPAGAVIMLLLSAVWFMALLVRLAGANVSSDERTQVVKMLVRGSLCVTGIEGTTLALCRASHYLSTTNIAYGKDAMRLLRAEWAPSLTPGLMYWQIRSVLGSVFPCMLAAFAVLAIAYWKRIQDRQANWAPSVLWGMVLSAAVCLTTGVWFWLAFSAISQVRYFTPFPLIAFVCVIPIVLRVLEVMPRWQSSPFAWLG